MIGTPPPPDRLAPLNSLRQVVSAIRPVAPAHMYVACDGPNPERPGEGEKVAATRKAMA